jgi:hypothetical protein
MKYKLSDTKHEKFFEKFDIDRTGTIDFEEFKEIFFYICDVRRELEDRGVDCPTFATRSSLLKILRPMIADEEEKERRAVAEALRYRHFMHHIRYLRAVA